MNNKDYDDTYSEAVRTNDPVGYTEKKWGDPKPYFNQFILPHVRNKTNITAIEIGSGLGRYTMLMKPYCGKIYAIEASAICIRYLGGLGEKIIPIRCGDISRINDASDLIFSFSTMLHFNIYEIKWYMDNIMNKLKSGGVFVLHYFSLCDGAEMFKKQKIASFGDVGRYFPYMPDDIDELMSMYNLKTLNNATPEKPIVPGHRVGSYVREK